MTKGQKVEDMRVQGDNRGHLWRFHTFLSDIVAIQAPNVTKGFL